jgi:hypothetical protein
MAHFECRTDIPLHRIAAKLRNIKNPKQGIGRAGNNELKRAAVALPLLDAAAHQLPL